MVSIAAVVLALGLGILAGTSVIGDRFAQSLESRYVAVVRERDEARSEVDDLANFTDDLVPYLTNGTLDGIPVVLVTVQDFDGGLVADTRQSLENAGADVAATVVLSKGLADVSDPNDQRSLATVLDEPTAAVADLPGDAAAAIAARLAGARSAGQDGQDDLLVRLRDAKFLLTDASAADLESIGGPGQAVVIVTDGDQSAAAPASSFMLPLVRDLVDLGRPVAIGEGVRTGSGLVAAVRGEDAIAAGDMVTVDDLDNPPGEFSLVLGLQYLISTPGGGAEYGVGGNHLPPALTTP
jgi:hypothetical protein